MSNKSSEFPRSTAPPKRVKVSLLVIIYHLLRDKQPYYDLGATYFETLDRERILKGAVRRLED